MVDFHFLRPLWFIALLALPLIIWLIRKLSHQYSGWQQVIPAHLQKVLMSQGNNKQSVSAVIPCIIFILSVLALAGPTYQKLPQPVFNVERGSVIVMDMSYSMYSTDVAPNRLTRSRFKAIDLLDSINEGDIGLVAYAGASFIISPLTQDINNIKLLLPSLTPEIMPEVGSDPFPALLTANDMLINAGHLKGDIYWLTDDADRLDVEAINEFISDYPHRLNILGVGTSDGAPIKLPNGELLKDDSGQIVIPKLPMGRLQGLARKSGGTYQTISHSHRDIDKLTSYQVPQDSKEVEQEQTKFGDSWQELGPYLVLLILPFALSYFRRGVILSLVPLLMFMQPSNQAFAQSANQVNNQATNQATNPPKASVPQIQQTPPSQLEQYWQNLWQTADQQAQQKYNDKAFQDAANQFKDPSWQASSHYRAGNFEKAAEALSGLDTPQALYNKGNALAKSGKLDEAIEAYEQALTAQPDFTQAADNKALIEKLKEQNQQQEQQNQDQQESDENKDNDQKGDQNGANDQQNKDDDNQNADNKDQQDGSEQGDSQNNEQPPEPQEKQNSEQNEESNQENKEQENEQNTQDQNQQEAEQQQQEMKQATAQESDQKQKELDQKHMQLLNKVTDDPHLLLRNKMQLEYQKRRHQNSGAKKKW